MFDRILDAFFVSLGSFAVLSSILVFAGLINDDSKLDTLVVLAAGNAFFWYSVILIFSKAADKIAHSIDGVREELKKK